METLTISYSFFTPKSLNKEMRFWDNYNFPDRYWYNIPSSMCVNNILYPNSKIKIHISPSIKNHFLFEMLEKIPQYFSNIEVVEMDYDYQNTEPTMWRYKPLLNKESDVVLCRDIDSLPNSDEFLATTYFLNNPNFFVHTLRTHTNHVIPQTIILAGLCGFRPKNIKYLQGVDFDSYYNHFKNAVWGLDQSSLINMFVREKDWVKNHFLDSPISTQLHRVGPPLIDCNSLNQDYYHQNVNVNLDKTLFDILDTETKWAGEPTNFRGQKFVDFLNLDYDTVRTMKDLLSSCSTEVQNFYFQSV